MEVRISGVRRYARLFGAVMLSYIGYYSLFHFAMLSALCPLSIRTSHPGNLPPGRQPTVASRPDPSCCITTVVPISAVRHHAHEGVDATCCVANERKRGVRCACGVATYASSRDQSLNHPVTSSITRSVHYLRQSAVSKTTHVPTLRPVSYLPQGTGGFYTRWTGECFLSGLYMQWLSIETREGQASFPRSLEPRLGCRRPGDDQWGIPSSPHL